MKGRKETKLYHYKDSGLDWVYLVNGFDVIEDEEYGVGVAIHNLDELNRFLAELIAESIPTIRGQEVRFLRSHLQFNQTQMARMLGVNLRTYQRWENSERNKPIPKTAEELLRIMILGVIEDENLEKLIHERYERIKNHRGSYKPTKKPMFKKLPIHETSKGWKAVA